MGYNNNILLIATMIVLILSISFMVNISIIGYSALDGINLDNSRDTSSGNNSDSDLIPLPDGSSNGNTSNDSIGAGDNSSAGLNDSTEFNNTSANGALNNTSTNVTLLPVIDSHEIALAQPTIESTVEVSARDLEVKEVSFVTNKELQNMQLRFNKLDSRPAQVTIEPPADFTYQYFQVVTSINSSDVAHASVTFDVTVSWLNQNNVSEDSVFLARWNTSDWKLYNTTVLVETQEKITYKADVPGFSIFAIVGQFVYNFTGVNFTGAQIGQPEQPPEQPAVPCPDGVCSGAMGEDCNTCPQDCGTCAAPCGDGLCDTENLEDATTCPQDCQTTDNTLLIIVAVAGTMVIMMLLMIYFLKGGQFQQQIKPAKKEEYMPGEDELIPYINQMRSSSYQEAQIKACLLKAGWRPDIVNKALSRNYKK